MNNQNISEEERHEAATEEAATVGCPSLGISKLPGGFDGSEPLNSTDPFLKVSEESRMRVEQAVVRQRQKLTQIADLALAAEAKSGNANVRLGSKYLENSKAIAEIRKLVGPGLAFEEKIAGRDKPLDPAAPEMKTQSEIQREEARQKRKIHWTAYPTKVDVCVMGRTEQNGKVYEVRIIKRGDSKVQDTYGQCKVNGKNVLTCSFIGSAWMLKRILTEGMQALVNYKAKRARRQRRNYAKRARAALAAKNAESAKEVK